MYYVIVTYLYNTTNLGPKKVILTITKQIVTYVYYIIVTELIVTSVRYVIGMSNLSVKVMWAYYVMVIEPIAT